MLLCSLLLLLLLMVLVMVRELRVRVLLMLQVMLLLMLLLRRLRRLLLLLVDTVVLTLEISAQHDGLLLRKVLGLLQQAQVVDEVGVAGRLLLHRRNRRGSVGVARVDELRPGQGPST